VLDEDDEVVEADDQDAPEEVGSQSDHGSLEDVLEEELAEVADQSAHGSVEVVLDEEELVDVVDQSPHDPLPVAKPKH